MMDRRDSQVVLITGCSSGIGECVARGLSGRGYRVLAAADSDQAMGLVSACDGAIDLLVTDVVLTGMGGRELAERITARYPAIRVLYVSGYTEDSILRRGVVSHGVTLVRDLGMNRANIYTKQAVEQGIFPGPRLLITGEAIIQTGGHTYWCCREATGAATGWTTSCRRPPSPSPVRSRS